jgi:hypothetical protein
MHVSVNVHDDDDDDDAAQWNQELLFFASRWKT